MPKQRRTRRPETGRLFPLCRHNARFLATAGRPAGFVYVVLYTKSAERVPRYVVYSAYLSDAASVVQRADNLRPVVYEPLQFGVTAFAAAENDTLFLSQFESFARAHRYQIALQLGHKSESKAKHFAVYRVVERVAVFGAVKTHFFFQQLADDVHNVHQRAAESR